MRDIDAAYRWVQAQKERPFAPDTATVDMVIEGLRRELGTDDIGMVQHALVGMGWVMRMIEEERLPVERTLALPNEIANNMVRNIGPRIEILSRPQLIQAGVGAGFHTGLWTGRRLDGR